MITSGVYLKSNIKYIVHILNGIRSVQSEILQKDIEIKELSLTTERQQVAIKDLAYTIEILEEKLKKKLQKIIKRQLINSLKISMEMF